MASLFLLFLSFIRRQYAIIHQVDRNDEKERRQGRKGKKMGSLSCSAFHEWNGRSFSVRRHGCAQIASIGKRMLLDTFWDGKRDKLLYKKERVGGREGGEVWANERTGSQVNPRLIDREPDRRSSSSDRFPRLGFSLIALGAPYRKKRGEMRIR